VLVVGAEADQMLGDESADEIVNIGGWQRGMEQQRGERKESNASAISSRSLVKHRIGCGARRTSVACGKWLMATEQRGVIEMQYDSRGVAILCEME
jgi:hypothetical protein